MRRTLFIAKLNIDYKEGEFYDAHYLKWSASDNKLARSLVDEALDIETE